MAKKLAIVSKIALLIISIFIIDEDTAFVKKNYHIEQARKEIVEIVRQRQMLGVSIPAPIEPPVRILRAIIPAVQSHYYGGRNHLSGN